MSKTRTKRINLTVHEKMYSQLEKWATEEGVSTLELAREALKLGLYFMERQKHNPDAVQFFIREGDKEQEVVLL
jgi:hypothetical protein